MSYVITIDGPSGAGKTTIAKLVARRLDLPYIPSGKLFRATAYILRQNNVDPADDQAVAQRVSNLDFYMNKEGRIIFNGQDISSELEKPEIGLLTAVIAQNPAVRQRLLDMQRSMGKDGCVIEGRSTGIEVFPQANLKIWLTADENARNQRKAGAKTAPSAQTVSTRDKMDKNRRLAPMSKAQDAIELDTTDISVAQAADIIVGYPNR